MGRARTVDRFMRAPTHSKPSGETCDVVTECAIHTVSLPEGSFASIVHSRPGTGLAVIAILDRDEVEEHIRLLRNAMDDAERLDAGKPTIHAPGSDPGAWRV